MHVYLPIAEMSVPAESLLLLGTVVGFLSGVFGVGGGFLATPFLIFMGIPPAIAVGTQANQLIASSVTGVLGHLRRGNVDLRMGSVMLGGGFVGAAIGILVFRLLQHLGQIDLVINILYVVLLGIIGLMMLFESVGAALRSRTRATEDIQALSQQSPFKNLPYKMRFTKSRLYISALLPAGVGLVGGLLISIMGIGGGFIMVPAMIYILGMPSLLVPGTSLFQIIFIAAFSCLLHAVANNTVDMVLAVILMLGSVVGAQAGVRVARYLKGAPARIVLALMIVIVSFRLAAELFLPPLDFYTTEVR
jgi:uncharacterized membrane protein YfcA